MQARARNALAGAHGGVGGHAVDVVEAQGRQVALIAGFDSTPTREIAGPDENGGLLPSSQDTLTGPTYEQWMRSQLS
jgi:hypothetical protein